MSCELAPSPDFALENRSVRQIVDCRLSLSASGEDDREAATGLETKLPESFLLRVQGLRRGVRGEERGEERGRGEEREARGEVSAEVGGVRWRKNSKIDSTRKH